MDNETRKSRLLEQCKFYKGEEQWPYEKFFGGWVCEKIWVRCLIRNDNATLDSAVASFRKLVDLSNPVFNDGTPIAVQALLFERFCQNSDKDPLVLAGYFPQYYSRYYINNECDQSSPETRR